MDNIQLIPGVLFIGCCMGIAIGVGITSGLKQRRYEKETPINTQEMLEKLSRLNNRAQHRIMRHINRLIEYGQVIDGTPKNQS